MPKLQAAGWDTDPHSIAGQRTFTDGRIIVRGNRTERRKPKRADDASGGELQLVAACKHRTAVNQLQSLLYTA